MAISRLSEILVCLCVIFALSPDFDNASPWQLGVDSEEKSDELREGDA
ncbi:MAG: hypothetical protein IIV64_04745 [Muribaculaceae bacterium]|nr:hypothetical protein [Muribaculaceae bacterium]